MIEIEDECVGCKDMGLPCLGAGCPNKKVPHFYCDECEDERDFLYEFEGKQLCDDCLLNKFEKVGFYNE